MRVWSVVSVRSVRLRIERVIAVIDGVTCGNLVNLGTRTAPVRRTWRFVEEGLTAMEERLI